MRNSFVFYASWWEAIKDLPRDVQGDVLTAIVEYGLHGEATGQLKPITRAILAIAKTQIDINNKRYENGKKGGRPRYNKNQTKTKPKPNNNQVKTKPKPNDNVNDNDNKEIVSTEVEPIKKSTIVQKEKHSAQYEGFLKWVRENTPTVLKLKTGFTEEQFYKIRRVYEFEQIANILQSMENYKELTKKYTSAYLTFLRWAKREYGDKP